MHNKLFIFIWWTVKYRPFLMSSKFGYINTTHFLRHNVTHEYLTAKLFYRTYSSKCQRATQFIVCQDSDKRASKRKRSRCPYLTIYSIRILRLTRLSYVTSTAYSILFIIIWTLNITWLIHNGLAMHREERRKLHRQEYGFWKKKTNSTWLINYNNDLR